MDREIRGMKKEKCDLAGTDPKEREVQLLLGAVVTDGFGATARDLGATEDHPYE